ncbi:MAG: 6-phosphogluconolactonase [Nitrospirae bacterium]|nr:6-phosphogluconolactonase [Nitrospirota bacterium]
MEASLIRDVRALPDADGAAHAATRIFAEASAEAVSLRNRFSVALSGGSTPHRLFHLLGSSHRGKLDWGHVQIFWADERCVPPDHEQSNFSVTHEALISRIDIPAENIHRIRGELRPEEAAAKYERDLRAYFGVTGIPRFDLILLGVGEDGHTASLFPGETAVSEMKRLAAQAFSSREGNWRVTLTLPVLNNAALVVFLVTGKEKARIIKTVLTEGKRNLYPAGLVRPHHGRVIWILDKDAASGLKETEQ